MTRIEHHSEAREVRAQEARQQGIKSSRPALYIRIDTEDPVENMYCEAFREIPYGYNKRAMMAWLDLIIGNCRDMGEAASVLYCWVKAREQEREAMLANGSTEEQRRRWRRCEAPENDGVRKRKRPKENKFVAQRVNTTFSPKTSQHEDTAPQKPPVRPATPPPSRLPAQQEFFSVSSDAVTAQRWSASK